MSISAIGNSVSDAVTGVNNTLTDACKSPSFSIKMGDKVLKELADRVLSLSLTDNRGFEADQLTIELDDSAGDVALPGRGVALSLWLGWLGEALIFKGVYTVDEVAHGGPPDRITVTARSADFREEFNVKREVSWHDVTVERVVSAIANRYGLKAQISDMLMNIGIDHADQTQESDMSFLTRMAEMLGQSPRLKMVLCCLSCRVVVSQHQVSQSRRLRSRVVAVTGTVSELPIVILILACGRIR